ncbi:hypothetical protein NX87_03840 [Neisseria meningitidis]|nr:hypothetical protein NX87_03840 [Neisseria meningitidis]
MKAIHPYACPRCCRLPANTFRTGMANSASKFCIAKGGRREVKKRRKRRRICLCHLPDSRIVEEWEYFRSQH